MADYADAKAENEVTLETPAAAKCEFVAIEPDAARSFVDFLLERQFTERRVALLYGRWVVPTARSGDKRGVLVDVVYEPPQSSDASRVELDASDAALAERQRASELATSLGLSLVGVAFSHPPRRHGIEPLELHTIVEHQHVAVATDNQTASDLFVGVRFRAVSDGEAFDGEVTAEVYQPSAQAVSLLSDGSFVPSEGGPPTRLLAAGNLSLKIGAEVEPTVDMAYMVARVHDVSRPHAPLPSGPLRTAFPVANRRGAEVRKFHVRTFLQRQAEAEVPFATCARDFQFLLHASGVLPPPLLARLCSALLATRVSKQHQAAIDEAQQALYEYAKVPARA